jgi:hypothetical protein
MREIVFFLEKGILSKTFPRPKQKHCGNDGEKDDGREVFEFHLTRSIFTGLLFNY